MKRDVGVASPPGLVVFSVVATGLAANSATAGTYEPGWRAVDSASDTTGAGCAGSLACGGEAPVPTGPAGAAAWNAHLSAANCVPFASWTPTAGTNERLPIDCISWSEAYAFCIWDGGFLPSKPELEYAQAGGSEQREYPWGTADPGTRNDYAIEGCNYPSGSGSCIGNVAPVGTATRGAGAWGQLDLAGELEEWNLDWTAPNANPCTDCAYLPAAGTAIGHTLRGGDFLNGATALHPPVEDIEPPGRILFVGVRCARPP